MRRLITSLVVAISVLAISVAPAAAVTTGQPDNEEHPYVGQLLFYDPSAIDSRFTDPGSWYNCSGTLLNSTIVVTAGHCTYGIGHGGTDIWIHFGEAANYEGFPLSGPYIPDRNGQRYIDRAAWLNDPANGWHRGTAHPHPDYDDNAFYLHDAGVVVLDTPVTMPKYGQVAGEGYLEKYRSTPRNEQRFEVVGYGLTKVLPIRVEGEDQRLKAEPKLDSLNGNPRNTYIILSNNKKTGGTCFGDSGGPTFDNTTSNLVVAVTSFGVSPNCTGIGGAYRLDQPDDLAFLATFGVTP
jgi:hypothetical protein